MLHALRIVKIQIRETFPSQTNASDFVTVRGRAIDDILNDGSSDRGHRRRRSKCRFFYRP